VSPIWYGTPEQPTTKHARLPLFGKAEDDLEMLSPTRDTPEFHAIRRNYQEKIWLEENKEHLMVTCSYKSNCKPAPRRTCSVLQYMDVM